MRVSTEIIPRVRNSLVTDHAAHPQIGDGSKIKPENQVGLGLESGLDQAQTELQDKLQHNKGRGHQREPWLKRSSQMKQNPH